jgi:hypothetical protein
MGFVADIFTSAASSGASIYQGQRADKQQKRALRLQERAQNAAVLAAQRQERINAQERKRVLRRKPDVTAILAAAKQSQGRGVNSTALSPDSLAATTTTQTSRLLGE